MWLGERERVERAGRKWGGAGKNGRETETEGECISQKEQKKMTRRKHRKRGAESS